MQEPLKIVANIFYLDPKKKRKLFTRESSQQAKEEKGNLFGFSQTRQTQEKKTRKIK